jgi:hypothetical protein
MVVLAGFFSDAHWNAPPSQPASAGPALGRRNFVTPVT